MTSTARACLGLLTLSSFFAFSACSDDDDGGPDAAAGQASEAGAPSKGGSGGTTSQGDGGAAEAGAPHGDGSIECKVLGELCHAADTGAGPAHDCHEIGHEGHADVCGAEFASCVGTCAEVDVSQGGAGSGADAKCAALGSLCHEAGEVDADAEECHEIGHVGNAADCATSFDSCATLCLAVLEQVEEGGLAGAGSGGAASGGAAAGGAGGAP